MPSSTLSAPRTIRLLEIHPGPASSALSCKSHQAHLDNGSVKYRALSYCWGESPTLTTIYVDGEAVEIRHNLDHALRRLRTNLFCCTNLFCSCWCEPHYPATLERQMTSPGLLWVDSLCINLEVSEEKSKQVAMMKDIYARAEEVVVWLGEEGGDTLQAFRMLHGLADLWDMAVEDAKPLLSHLVRNEQFRAHWLALGQLLARAWWQRIWVIQEIVMARKAFVVCGRWAVEWDRIEKASATFKYCFTYIDELQESDIFRQSEELQAFTQNAANLQLITLLRFFCQNPPPTNPHNFETLLALAKDKDSTKPQDKIYALLGIWKDLKYPDLLEVDYGITTCTLYMQVCQVLYNYTGNVNFLELVERDRITKDDQKFGLPIWCPDWTAPSALSDDFSSHNGRTVPQYNCPSPEFKTIRLAFTRDSTSKCEFDLEAKRMTVRGFKVDVVGAIERRWIDLHPEFRASLEPTKRYCKRICWDLRSPEEEFECNKFWFSRLRPDRLVKDNTSPPEPPDRNPREAVTINTSCFMTQQHQLFGQTHVPVQQGDYICAFLGARMPYILRPQNGTWRLLGQW